MKIQNQMMNENENIAYKTYVECALTTERKIYSHTYIRTEERFQNSDLSFYSKHLRNKKGT